MSSRTTVPLTPDDFAAQTDVLPGVVDRLRRYEGLLRKWQPAINLVGPSTLPDLWRRHFLDSAQLWPLGADRGERLLDVGAGAGFPGLVLAAMGAREVHLVESDARKAAFLVEAVRGMGLSSVRIHARRIQDVSRETLSGVADVITARAWGTPGEVLAATSHLCDNGALYLLPVGRGGGSGLTELRKGWKVDVAVLPSRTDPESSILRIRGVSRGTTTHQSGPADV